MKRQVMQPFRAARKPNAKSSPIRQSPRRQGKQDQEGNVLPYKKGIRVMSYKEALEMSKHGEVLRWSSKNEGEVEETKTKTNEAQKDTTDNEEPTELGVVWQPYIIKETQYNDVEEIIGNGKCERNGQRFSIEANVELSPVTRHEKRTAIATNAASPSCSEFEAFLDKASASVVAQRPSSKNDAYWENVLEGEKQRLAMDIEARTISVDDIMLGDESADDNLPIAATLPGKKSLEKRVTYHYW
jgi:hypothetical protein